MQAQPLHGCRVRSLARPRPGTGAEIQPQGLPEVRLPEVHLLEARRMGRNGNIGRVKSHQRAVPRYVNAAVATVLAASLAGCQAASAPELPSAASVSLAPSHQPAAPGSPAAAPPSSAEPEHTTEPAALTWGPTREQYEEAAAAVARMSTEQKAGQVLVPFYRGKDPAPVEAAIRELHLAGTIVMGDNVPLATDGRVDAAAMAAVNERFSSAVAATGRDWPAVVAVDQEGGLVARLKAPLTEWPAPMTLGASADQELARTSMKAMNTELSAMGFTMNHAPTADATLGAADPTIGARSYAGDPDLAARLTTAATEGALESGVLPAVKHFPGHGSVTTDSHVDVPVQPAPLGELQARDWLPFREAVRQGAPVVMMGHIAVDALEPGVPASLSAASYRALRGLGFEGVAVTDALNMGAIEQHYPGGQAAPRALAAGADLLLMPSDIHAAHAAVVGAVNSGAVTAARLDEAATRVVALMKWQQTLAAPAALSAVGSHSTVSKAATAAGMTVVEGQCTGDLLRGAVSVVGGSPEDRRRFTAAAQARGLAVGTGTVVALLEPGARTQAAGPDQGTAAPGRVAGGDIAVTLDAPWQLAASTAPTKIALFGRTPEAFDALLDVLTGKAAAPGNLPAAVGPYPAGTGC